MSHNYSNLKALVSVTLWLLGTLSAVFTGPNTARITWTQPEANVRTCLVRYYGAQYPSGICSDYWPAGEVVIDLPGPYRPLWAYEPKNGDRYEVWRGGEAVESTYLGDKPVYLALLPIVNTGSSVVYQVYLPTAGV